ncbi:MAG TPA: hypothetical protein PKY30_25295 [Myxococcota bacterium]|nr:hypothetical protein [Myxococcota bacterium]HNH50373.1 hypothetical protein [Myxococcota bacterium]
MVREIHQPRPEAPNHDQYYRDLARMDELMNQVEPGSVEEAEYLALLDSLERYEEEHFSLES